MINLYRNNKQIFFRNWQVCSRNMRIDER
jgi:hypothetical protein